VIITFRRPTTKPVHPANWQRPAGNTDFRVTQDYDSLDGYYQGTPHRAVDLGNFRCGDDVVAMAAGTLRRTSDSAGALGAIIEHGGGISTEYWHLDGYVLPASGKIASGQKFGVVGDTGLGGVCHLHVEAKRDGVRFDPEPLIFGGSVDTEDGDMVIYGSDPTHVVNRNARLTTSSKFRSEARLKDAGGTDTTITTLPQGSLINPILKVTGQSVGTAPDKTDWYYGIKTLSGKATMGCVHSSVLPRTADGKGVNLSVTEDTDCTDEVAAANKKGVAAEHARWMKWRDTYPKVVQS